MAELQVRKLKPEFGVEITGLIPSVPLDPLTVRRLRALFDEHGLLAFSQLKPDARFQTYLAEQLVQDEPIDLDELFVDEFHQVSNVEKVAAVPLGRIMFHSDTMWIEQGCKAISLYGKMVSPGAIPTMFISAGHAWKTLPEDLKKRVEGKTAVQCADATEQRRTHISDDVMVVDFGSRDMLPLPIAYPHPRTGQTLLYVSPQLTHHIEGMSDEDSENLLDALFDHMSAEKNVFTHEWREGDLIVWDNIALQHARPDLRAEDAPRTLRKTLVPSPKMYMTPPEGQPAYAVTYRRVGEAEAANR
jgi:taurine dioxygenase